MMCDHEHVTIYSKLAYPATRYEPAEYDEWAQCDDCGDVMDVSDIPDGAEEDTGDPDLWDVPEWDDNI